jgi:hypothetical protein
MGNTIHIWSDAGFAVCGASLYVESDPANHDRASVTCKRCLASLAKRDREFRRKARKGLGFTIGYARFASMDRTDRYFAVRAGREAAADAIAREENTPAPIVSCDTCVRGIPCIRHLSSRHPGAIARERNQP